MLVRKIRGNDKVPSFYPRSGPAAFAHRASAAVLALTARSSGVMRAARASPPFRPPRRPSAWAARFFRFSMGGVCLDAYERSSEIPLTMRRRLQMLPGFVTSLASS